MKLTNSGIIGLKVPAGKRLIRVSDDMQRGLCLQVTQNDVKSWQLRFSLHGKATLITLGRFPGIGLAEARKLAGSKMAQVDRGNDPRGNVDTVSAAFEVYWRTREGRLKLPKPDRSAWDRHIAPVIGALPIGKLSPLHFDQLQAHWVVQGLGAGQTNPLRVCRHFVGWLIDRRMIDREFIPRRVVLPQGGTYATPTFEETLALYRWCCAIPDAPHAQIIALLILTGSRLDMIRGLRWDEVVGCDHLAWPGSRMKAKHAFRQPLSLQAEQWLDRVPSNGTQWVWPKKTRDGPCKVMVHGWVTRAGFAPPPHSLRKGMATWLAGQGYSDALIGLCLSHTPQGVVSIYQKNDRLDERRMALNAWGEALAG
jgi:hypothetical protein